MNNIFLYALLFITAVIENLFPPVPGDTITAFGAFLVGTGRLNYIWVYLLTTTGSVTGFMLLFLFGKHFGRQFFYKKNYKYFPVKKIKKTELWISKYGMLIVLLNRFLPGVRSVISIVSGISNLNTFLVMIMAIISASVWNFIWIHTAFLLGSNWEIVKRKFSEMIKNYNMAAAGILILIIAAMLIYKYIIKRKRIDKYLK